MPAASRTPLGHAAVYGWALPNTLVGLLFVPLALASPARPEPRWRTFGGRPRLRLVDGVLEVHGPLIGALLRHAVPLPGGALAITFGHVVVAGDARALDLTRAHERVHVRQYERWGPLFIPAYLLASAWSWWQGRGAYDGNWFEVEAIRTAGTSRTARLT